MFKAIIERLRNADGIIDNLKQKITELEGKNPRKN